VNAPGFYIRRLEARGRSRTTAALEFTAGLNVISGASDTGKSYLVECIDFMLGGSTVPKSIEEAAGYEVLWLEIETWDGKPYSLERSLRGGDLRRYDVRLADIGPAVDSSILKRQHGSNGESASEFFLNLAALDKVKIRTNAAGRTRNVTYRDVAHMTLVKEEQIYSTGSPTHPSAQYVLRTAESSFFRYLLTGVDDSTVISREIDTDARSRRLAQVDAIEELMRQSQAAVSELTDSPQEIQQQIQRINASLLEMTRSISLDRQRLQEQQRQRQELWNRVQRRSARSEVLARLQNRFGLLDEHYRSDLQRLAAIAEAAAHLNRLPELPCPLCGATGSLNQHLHANEPAIGVLAEASASEMSKIRAMRQDLASTISDITTEATELARGNQRDTRSYERVVQLIENELQPAEDVSRGEFEQLMNVRARLERAEGIIQQIQLLQTERDRIAATVPAERRERPATETTATKTSESSDFCEVVEELLKAWNFPGAGRVTFSEENEDIVIAGQDRKSHGKGIRALAYSGFILSLLKYCRSKDRSHPGLVVLDSPLVAYREPDTAAEVQRLDVKGAFFRTLATWKDSMQVIVFENEDPPADLVKSVNLTHFSKTNVPGVRYGFFPAATDPRSKITPSA
jgi:hypothetical protein